MKEPATTNVSSQMIREVFLGGLNPAPKGQVGRNKDTRVPENGLMSSKINFSALITVADPERYNGWCTN